MTPKHTKFTASVSNKRLCQVFEPETKLKVYKTTLVWWLIWLERHPIHLKIVGSIPSQSMNLGCRFDYWSEHMQEATDWCYFSLYDVSFSSPHLFLSPSI